MRPQEIIIRCGISLRQIMTILWLPIMLAVVCEIPGSTVIRADDASLFNDVQRILSTKCFSCHGPEIQESGLRLDTESAARAGGDRGPALVPGDADASLLTTAVTFRDPDLQMPPKQKLTDREIDILTLWVEGGAAWPLPVMVLFEDDDRLLRDLTSGNGHARLVHDDAFSGTASLGITPLQRDSAKIPGWNFSIRENPENGQYRFLRLAWKKRGEGSVMLELAGNGKWPEATAAQGRYVAGPNTTGWNAMTVSEVAPNEWTVITLDLWKDIGDFELTGCAPTCDAGEEAFFDAMILGPTTESLDAYSVSFPWIRIPGEPSDALEAMTAAADAFSDERNPVRQIFGEDRLDLWSLQPPSASERSIDELVEQKLTAAGRNPAPEADSRTLIRRLTFDLTGLPPTAEEVSVFLDDCEVDPESAYVRLADRLLNSPRYGERQARLWLDVVRYADTNGYERDEFRPLIWQYRDYVVRSFNDDKPYDVFIREQLAGDELLAIRKQYLSDESSVIQFPSPDEDLLVATGFLRLGQWDSTASIFQEEDRLRAEILADLTNTTASAFLGLTMSCCQCHDHKYDPLLQADHFRLRAFFAAVQDRNDTVISTDEELREIEQHNDSIDEQIRPLQQELQALLEGSREQVRRQRRDGFPENIRKQLDEIPESADEASDSLLNTFRKQLNVSDDDARAAYDTLSQQKEADLRERIEVIGSGKREPRRAMTATDSGPDAPPTYLLFQGDHASPREEIAPGFPTLFTSAPASILHRPAGTTGRRLTLADWIASPDNPWTARVLVNRIWQQHFGTGLVATPNDFGHTGAPPVHQELLDTLAANFVADGWSIRRLHRRIVLSRTYRQTSAVTPDQVGFLRPEGLVQTIRRVDAETLRDSLLYVAGLLQTKNSGRPVWPPVPDELLKAQPAILEAEGGGDGGRLQGWYSDPEELTDVRSIFLIRKRCLPVPFLQVFDLPDTTVSCGRRDTTVVAPQALMLFNSMEAVRSAEALAGQLTADAGNFDDPAVSSKLVNTLFEITLSRPASAEEQSLAVEFLNRHRAMETAADPAEANRRAFVHLCRAVINLNEFSWID